MARIDDLRADALKAIDALREAMPLARYQWQSPERTLQIELTKAVAEYRLKKEFER